MLKQIIREKIEKEGAIPFEAFMDYALYHHGLGYYMTDRIRIGPHGDFYTAPHLHPIFGWLLALQLDELKHIAEDPDDYTILEIGSGRGYLAEGILDFIHRNLKWKGNWRYIIVERNAHTVKDQQKLLERYENRVTWKTSLDEVDRFRGCILSNELLDAFPVHRVMMHDQFQEVYVAADENGFIEVYRNISTPEVADYIRKYKLPQIKGYRTEINLRIKDYLDRANDHLSEGFIISIDYGYSARQYYAEERNKGTLLCYSKHTLNENPYLNPGNQDITAHVNFTSLKDWGEDLGLKAIGYCPQGTFLASLGIEDIISRKLGGIPDFERELLKIKTLLFDMGESHQVMIQYKGKGDIQGLKGFKLKNRITAL
jgi:SAM-dependent MidA family methyltransferase